MHHVSDFVIRVKNSYRARRKQVVMPYSNLTKAVAQVLVKEGFLAEVKEAEVEGKKALEVSLRYENRRPAFHEVKIVSKPSLRVYLDKNAIAKDKDHALTSVLSTSSGVMTGKEALKKGLGGELLFKIW